MSIAQLETMNGRIFFGKFSRFEKNEMCIWLENVCEIEKNGFMDEKRGIKVFTRNSTITESDNGRDHNYEEKFDKEINKEKSKNELEESFQFEYDESQRNQRIDKVKETKTCSESTREQKGKFFSFMKFSILHLRTLKIDSIKIKVDEIDEKIQNLNFPILGNNKAKKQTVPNKNIKNSKEQLILEEIDANKSKNYIDLAELDECIDNIVNTTELRSDDKNLSFFDDTSISGKSFRSKNSSFNTSEMSQPYKPDFKNGTFDDKINLKPNATSYPTKNEQKKNGNEEKLKTESNTYSNKSRRPKTRYNNRNNLRRNNNRKFKPNPPHFNKKNKDKPRNSKKTDTDRSNSNAEGFFDDF